MSQYGYWADEHSFVNVVQYNIGIGSDVYIQILVHIQTGPLFNIVKQKCKKSKVKCNRDIPCSLFNTEEPNLLSYCPTFETYAI